MKIVYLLQDPRTRLADMKAANKYHGKTGGAKNFRPNSHQQIIPQMCGEMLETVDYLTGHAKIAPGIMVHSLRHEDLLLDMDQEVKVIDNELFANHLLIQVRQIMRALRLKLTKTTEDLIKKLEFPDEYLEENPGKVTVVIIYYH